VKKKPTTGSSGGGSSGPAAVGVTVSGTGTPTSNLKRAPTNHPYTTKNNSNNTNKSAHNKEQGGQQGGPSEGPTTSAGPHHHLAQQQYGRDHLHHHHHRNTMSTHPPPTTPGGNDTDRCTPGLAGPVIDMNDKTKSPPQYYQESGGTQSGGVGDPMDTTSDVTMSASQYEEIINTRRKKTANDVDENRGTQPKGGKKEGKGGTQRPTVGGFGAHVGIPASNPSFPPHLSMAKNPGKSAGPPCGKSPLSNARANTTTRNDDSNMNNTAVQQKESTGTPRNQNEHFFTSNQQQPQNKKKKNGAEPPSASTATGGEPSSGEFSSSSSSCSAAQAAAAFQKAAKAFLSSNVDTAKVLNATKNILLRKTPDGAQNFQNDGMNPALEMNSEENHKNNNPDINSNGQQEPGGAAEDLQQLATTNRECSKQQQIVSGAADDCSKGQLESENNCGQLETTPVRATSASQRYYEKAAVTARKGTKEKLAHMKKNGHSCGQVNCSEKDVSEGVRNLYLEAAEQEPEEPNMIAQEEETTIGVANFRKNQQERKANQRGPEQKKGPPRGQNRGPQVEVVVEQPNAKLNANLCPNKMPIKNGQQHHDARLLNNWRNNNVRKQSSKPLISQREEEERKMRFLLAQKREDKKRLLLKTRKREEKRAARKEDCTKKKELLQNEKDCAVGGNKEDVDKKKLKDRHNVKLDKQTYKEYDKKLEAARKRARQKEAEKIRKEEEEIRKAEEGESPNNSNAVHKKRNRHWTAPGVLFRYPGARNIVEGPWVCYVHIYY